MPAACVPAGCGAAAALDPAGPRPCDRTWAIRRRIVGSAISMPSRSARSPARYARLARAWVAQLAPVSAHGIQRWYGWRTSLGVHRASRGIRPFTLRERARRRGYARDGPEAQDVPPIEGRVFIRDVLDHLPCQSVVPERPLEVAFPCPDIDRWLANQLVE